MIFDTEKATIYHGLSGAGATVGGMRCEEPGIGIGIESIVLENTLIVLPIKYTFRVGP